MAMIYAIYDDDEFITVGTSEEVAKELGIAVSTVYFLTSKTHHKRYREGQAKRIAIKWKEQEDD